MDCLFCKISSGEIPSQKIFENDKILVFLDIFPSAKGHSLVVPKKHYETLLDIPKEELCELMNAVKENAKKIVSALNADGFNIMQNNKKSAGQLVPHLHFHIIPRFENDGLRPHLPQTKASEEELEETRKKILG